MKVSLSILAVLLLAISMLATSSDVANAQPGVVIVNSLDPFDGDRGQFVQVFGGPFDERTSEVIFDGDRQETFYRSNSELWFVVPVGAGCGAHSVVVESEVSLAPFGTTTATSLPVIYVVNCASQFSKPARSKPVIYNYTLNKVGTDTYEIVVRGENFLPRANDGYPSSWIDIHWSTGASSGNTGGGKSERVSLDTPGQIRAAIERLQLENCDWSYELKVYNQYDSGSAQNLREYSETKTFPPQTNCAPEERLPPPPSPSAAVIEISDLSFTPDELEVGEQFRVYYRVTNVGSAPTGAFDIVIRVNEIEFSRIDVNPIAAGSNTNGSTRRLIQVPPGVYTIYVEALGESVAVDGTLTVTPATGPPNEDPPPPPPVIGGNLSDYDQDNDCKLSDGEFFDMIDAWIGESINNLLFFSGVDAWIGQTSTCTSASSTSSVELRNTPNGILLSMRGGDPLGQIFIYDIGGSQVFRSYASGTKLFWNMQSEFGEPIANGVYFIRFGNIGELRKFVVMR